MHCFFGFALLFSCDYIPPGAEPAPWLLVTVWGEGAGACQAPECIQVCFRAEAF